MPARREAAARAAAEQATAEDPVQRIHPLRSSITRDLTVRRAQAEQAQTAAVAARRGAMTGGVAAAGGGREGGEG